MAVTPVRIDSPSTIVLWPTRTPATSVIAFHFPGGRTPGRTPRSRMRGRSSPLRAPQTKRSPTARKRRSRFFVAALLRITGASTARNDTGRHTGSAARCLVSFLLLILDLVGGRGASRALQVVLHPLHHPEVVVAAVRGQAG